jgi:hypothetical protein
MLELLDELLEPVELVAAGVVLFALWPACGAANDGLKP